MRHFSFPATALLLSTLLTGAMPLAARESSSQPSDPSTRSQTLDPKVKETELLQSLKRERDSTKAEGIAKELVAQWEDFGSSTINTLMKRGTSASDEKQYAAALDYFDQVITLEPKYAQAYYRRAFVNFAEGQTKKAITDLYQTLELNPEHFGALFELARLMSLTGHEKPALAALERFLAIYPSFTEARELYRDLSEKLAGTRI